MLYQCPTCHGRGTVTVRKQSRRKGEGDEQVEQDCQTCDGAGQLDRTPE